LLIQLMPLKKEADMELYAAIDLHSNNSVLVVTDLEDHVVFAKRLRNDLELIVSALRGCRGAIRAVAVESTYNWYWLVDGLKAAGFDVRLANTAAIKQYDGLKHGDDFSDAKHLAQLLRLGILPEGYICPPELRALRDLMRKRAQLVRQRTTHILSIHNLFARNLAKSFTGDEIKRLEDGAIDALALLEDQKRAVKANAAVMRCLEEQIRLLERAILAKGRLRKEFPGLKTVSGIGDVLALTIALETGDIHRFASPGRFASYARMVASRRESNGKTKGVGNRKCGNKHLSWAFIEAAHHAVRYDPSVRRFYQRKCAKGLSVVAIKAVAHKLARACYHIMRDGVVYDGTRAFA
jgi:transposase